MITIDNYEEYLMMQMDGELSPMEEAELDQFLLNHPELKAEQTQYAAIKMVADMDITFANKSALIKEEPAAKRIPFVVNRRYWAAAAAVVFMLSVGTVWYQQNSSYTNTNSQVAVNEHGQNSSSTGTTKPAHQEMPSIDTAIVNTSDAINQSKTPNTTTNNPIKNNKVIGGSATPINTVATTVGTVKQATIKTDDQLENTAVAAVTKLELQSINPSAPEKYQVVVPEYDAQAAAYITPMYPNLTPENKSWLDKLPIDDVKKNSLSNLGETVAQVDGQITNIKNKLSEKSLRLRFERKRIVVSF